MRTSDYWIEALNLEPHPEGGFYRRTYCSKNVNHYETHQAERPSSTAIYYLLKAGDFSAFHRIKSDEMWHYYTGTSDILIHVLESNDKIYQLSLGLNNNSLPQQVIAGGKYFAAELMENQDDAFALVGCTVSPGFDFQEFELGSRANLLKDYPKHETCITRLTRQ